MKKNPIYLYVLLFFSTVGTFNSLASTFISSKAFELSDDFAKQMGLTTAQDKADYVTYMEKSVQVNQSPFAFFDGLFNNDCLTCDHLFPICEERFVESSLCLYWTNRD